MHSTVVHGAAGLHAVAVLVEYLAAKFLETYGTAFTSRLHLTPQQICENYSIAMKTGSQYEGLGATGVLAFFGRAPARKLPPNRNLPGARHAAYFVNSHHVAAFRRAFPHVYEFVFTALNSDNALTRLEVQGVHHLNAMKHQCRNAYEQLVGMLGA